MESKIVILSGDGIGPEIADATLHVLSAVETKFSHRFTYSFPLIGGAAIDKTGAPLPPETVDECLSANGVLLGAVGGPKWDDVMAHIKPERGLLGLRSAMGLYANIRPAILYDELKSASPLRSDILKKGKGIDLIIVRELTGGIYFGERGYRDGAYGQEAFDTETYSIMEIERIAKRAFDIAASRRRKLTSVDKANVLQTSRLWRATVAKIAQSYPQVEYENMYVDNCAMQLVKDPSQFDVILTTNMFGDILSDLAAMLTGSIGLLPSSSLGASQLGLYEPIHGSAPDIAGKDIANPIGMILSAAMMFSTSLDLENETVAIENAVKRVLKNYRTADIDVSGKRTVSCSKMGELIAMEVLNG